MIRFYMDTHVPKQVAVQLQLRGIEVVRCQELGLENASDTEHLQYATEQLRTVITYDRDFLRLDAEWRTAEMFHAGIYYVRPEYQGDVGTVVKELVFLAEAITAGAATLENDVYNQIIRIR